MAYIGKQPGTGVRNRFLYTATAGQTTFTTSDSNLALSYSDALYMDVYLNGVLLDPANDYTATSGTSVVLGSGATAGDVLEIVVYDVFSVFNNTIDGNFDVAGNTTLDNNVTVGGDLTISDKIIHSGDTNTAIRFPSNDTVTFETAGSERMRVTSTGNIQIGSTNSGVAGSLDVSIGSTSSTGGITLFSPTDGAHSLGFADGTTGTDRYRGYVEYQHANDRMDFATAATVRMTLDSSGRVLVGKTASAVGTPGAEFQPVTSTSSAFWFIKNTSANAVLFLNRTSSAGDGRMINFAQDGTNEGFISVSGSTVTYNGGHLGRLSQLADGTKDTSIIKGTVMTNLDQMAVWSHDAVEAQDAVLDDDGNVVTEAVEAKDAYTEDNEQLNCMAVSSVEGDPNVAGVFVNWDEEDDGFNDMNIAMTGDMVIRIAQGTTVARGDLLMSAGDGTAKPQGDDIVRSKTIAKVTSTQVSHTYDDGTYLVPCVLMAC